jgi:hypothetical protein
MMVLMYSNLDRERNKNGFSSCCIETCLVIVEEFVLEEVHSES